MKKDELLNEILKRPVPQHIALILDGNGRWATSKGLPRNMGHQKGANTLEEVVKAANKIGVKYITAYVFSTENWSRPKEEVEFIMKEVIKLCKKWQKLKKENVKINVIGSKENVPSEVQDAIDEAMNNTKDCNGATINMAFNYGSKKEIIDATKKIATLVKEGHIEIDDINESLFEDNLYTSGMPQVDLLIRTSGEIRISNYLLWQIAYAEMYFTKVYWPDFHTKEFYEAVYEFQRRNRRFGGLEKK